MPNQWIAKSTTRLRMLLPALMVFLLACGTLPAVVSTPQGDTCELANMTGSAAWQGLGEMLDGSLMISNYTQNTCSFKGIPLIHILDSGGNALDIQQISPPDAPSAELIELAPDQSMQTTLSWSNWCDDSRQDATSLEITLPDQTGKLKIPITDPNGQPLIITPSCGHDNQPSTLVVYPFQAH